MHGQYLNRVITIVFFIMLAISNIIVLICKDVNTKATLFICLPVLSFIVLSILSMYFDDSDDDSYGYGAFN